MLRAASTLARHLGTDRKTAAALLRAAGAREPRGMRRSTFASVGVGATLGLALAPLFIAAGVLFAGTPGGVLAGLLVSMACVFLAIRDSAQRRADLTIAAIDIAQRDPACLRCGQDLRRAASDGTRTACPRCREPATHLLLSPDRPFGFRARLSHCISCNYDLRDLPATGPHRTCPECGTPNPLHTTQPTDAPPP